MRKNSFFFIVFEGIEGTGKSYQIKKLTNKLYKLKYNVKNTREPGGSHLSEKIRNLIFDKKNINFDDVTDYYLMLASRNEHIKTTIKNAIKKKQILICDRFVDSTYAYQIVGKKIKKSVNEINKKYILGKLKPDMTIVLKANMKTVFSRLKKRKNKNKFDKLNESFYTKIQRTFIKKTNNKNYYLFDTSNNDSIIENNILKLVLKRLNN
jgi:dTMP kinase